MLDALQNPILWAILVGVALVLIKSKRRDEREQRNIQIGVQKALEEERKKEENKNTRQDLDE